MEYIVNTTSEQQEGFEFKSGLTGEKVGDLINRIVTQYGDIYLKKKKLAAINDLTEKIIKAPDDYKPAIDAIYAQKVANEKADADAKIAELPKEDVGEKL